MNHSFSKVSILGGGLLGGSLALVLPRHALLWARRQDTAAEAVRLGIPSATTDLERAVRDCELLILAVPVGAMPGLLRQAMEAGLPDNCLITDVGSVKSLPHLSLSPLLAGSGRHFIGSHPMAGSEQAGIGAARADLFQGAACLLTNDNRVGEELASRLERFWQEVGCRTRWMDAAAHDALVARISHLPHILAAAAALTCLENPAEGALGGGGLRDTTRVASGNVAMWTEILIENRAALAAPLQRSIDELNRIREILEANDPEAARQWLGAAKDRRDSL